MTADKSSVGKNNGDRTQIAGYVRSDLNSLHRQQAEVRLQQKAVSIADEVTTLSPEATRQLLHELGVHQIELEMQNEELRESQIALDAARERYFDLYDLAPVGYFAISEHGLIRQANLTAAGVFGVVRSALHNQPLSKFILPEDQDIYYRNRKQLIDSSEMQSFELRMLKDGGASFWAHLTMTLAFDADSKTELRVVLNDISERMLLQNDILIKNAELEQAIVIADKANQAKSDFLSSMSHELRTPLHAILGFAQLLESGSTPESPAPTAEQQQSIGQILKAGWHLLELINEILDLAVIEAGKIVLSMESVSLPEIIRDCESMATPMAQLRNIAIVFPTAEIPCVVHADRIRLKQVLINLLSNAIKYNVPGGTVSVSYGTTSKGRIRICVTDTGKGLSQDKLKQLFQPFNRLGHESDSEEGTGIGLVVCKRLAELMEGAIGVESTEQKGSVFWIELNQLAALPVSHQQIAQTAHQVLHHAGLKSRTLLYVEDNLANLKLVEAIIARRPDIQLITAANGFTGVDMACEFLPDMILMDIDLPDLSGLDAIKLLTQNPTSAHIPVIAISANAMVSDIEKGMQAGFFRYLTKPIRVDEFMKLLDENLGST